MHYLKVPPFSFPHDLQGITTRDLGHVVLYESEIRNNRLIYCFIIHRHGVAPGCAWHGKCRWTWPWNGERMVNWGPHSKVAKLRLITCILPGQPPMGLGTTSTTAKLSALLNQRCKVVMWYIQYMVLLQELLHIYIPLSIVGEILAIIKVHLCKALHCPLIQCLQLQVCSSCASKI